MLGSIAAEETPILGVPAEGCQSVGCGIVGLGRSTTAFNRRAARTFGFPPKFSTRVEKSVKIDFS